MPQCQHNYANLTLSVSFKLKYKQNFPMRNLTYILHV